LDLDNIAVTLLSSVDAESFAPSKINAFDLVVTVSCCAAESKFDLLSEMTVLIGSNQTIVSFKKSYAHKNGLTILLVAVPKALPNLRSVANAMWPMLAAGSRSLSLP